MKGHQAPGDTPADGCLCPASGVRSGGRRGVPSRGCGTSGDRAGRGNAAGSWGFAQRHPLAGISQPKAWQWPRFQGLGPTGVGERLHGPLNPARLRADCGCGGGRGGGIDRRPRPGARHVAAASLLAKNQGAVRGLIVPAQPRAERGVLPLRPGTHLPSRLRRPHSGKPR